jgi:hypothetical protein
LALIGGTRCKETKLYGVTIHQASRYEVMGGSALMSGMHGAWKSSPLLAGRSFYSADTVDENIDDAIMRPLGSCAGQEHAGNDIPLDKNPGLAASDHQTGLQKTSVGWHVIHGACHESTQYFL